MSRHIDYQKEWLKRHAEEFEIPQGSDLITAIRILVKANFFEEAVELLLGSSRHDVIDVLHRQSRTSATVEVSILIRLSRGLDPELIILIAQNHIWLSKISGPKDWFLQAYDEPNEFLIITNPEIQARLKLLT